jgi:hypothetical protein
VAFGVKVAVDSKKLLRLEVFVSSSLSRPRASDIRNIVFDVLVHNISPGSILPPVSEDHDPVLGNRVSGRDALRPLRELPPLLDTLLASGESVLSREHRRQPLATASSSDSRRVVAIELSQ